MDAHADRVRLAGDAGLLDVGEPLAVAEVEVVDVADREDLALELAPPVGELEAEDELGGLGGARRRRRAAPVAATRRTVTPRTTSVPDASAPLVASTPTHGAGVASTATSKAWRSKATDCFASERGAPPQPPAPSTSCTVFWSVHAPRRFGVCAARTGRSALRSSESET